MTDLDQEYRRKSLPARQSDRYEHDSHLSQQIKWGGSVAQLIHDRCVICFIDIVLTFREERDYVREHFVKIHRMHPLPGMNVFTVCHGA